MVQQNVVHANLGKGSTENPSDRSPPIRQLAINAMSCGLQTLSLAAVFGLSVRKRVMYIPEVGRAKKINHGIHLELCNQFSKELFRSCFFLDGVFDVRGGILDALHRIVELRCEKMHSFE